MDEDSSETDETIDVKPKEQLEKPATIRWIQPVCISEHSTSSTKKCLENEDKKLQQTMNKMKRASQQQQERIDNFWENISMQVQMMMP